jgi:hypothetical protein
MSCGLLMLYLDPIHFVGLVRSLDRELRDLVREKKLFLLASLNGQCEQPGNPIA